LNLNINSETADYLRKGEKQPFK